MKLIDIANSKEALNMLNSMLLPIKQSLKIMEITDKLEKHIVHYFTLKDKLLIEYGETKDGKNYTIKEENKEIYAKSIEELNNTNIDVERAKLELNSGTIITPANLKAINKVVDLEVI